MPISSAASSSASRPRNSSTKKSRITSAKSPMSPRMVSPRRLNGRSSTYGSGASLSPSLSGSSATNGCTSPSLSKEQISLKIHERLTKLKLRSSVDGKKKRKERFTSPKKSKESPKLISNELTPKEKIYLVREAARTEKIQKRELREYHDQSEKRAKGTLQLLQSHLNTNNGSTPKPDGIMEQLRILEQRYGQRQFSPQRQRLMAKNEKYSSVPSRFASPPRQNGGSSGSGSARKASLAFSDECTFSPTTNKQVNEKLGAKSKFKSVHKITNSPSAQSTEKEKIKLMDKDLTFHPKINENSKVTGQSRLFDYLEKQTKEKEERKREKSTTKRKVTPKKVSARLMTLSRPKSPPPAVDEGSTVTPKSPRTPRTPRSARSARSRSSSIKRKITPKRSLSAKRKTRALSAKKTKTPLSPRSTALSPRSKRSSRDHASPSRQLSPNRAKSSRKAMPPSRQFSPRKALKSPRRTTSARKATSPSRQLSPTRALSPRVSSPKLSRKREITNYDHVPVGVFIHGSPRNNGHSAEDDIPHSFSPHTLERVEKLRQQLDQQSKGSVQQIHKPGGFIELEG
uniref:Uncharacterized protein n=1 Tax=Percolomonas cosmopolitus TaxID=63605 RepID=A0A7S1PEI9_9EUKA|mmetsp:Transcript_129/g.468  ORF Transcript_129/g.468 Transcript_129/m.468 type:complete len:571 (+) Transcript_129:394-2106(+)